MLGYAAGTLPGVEESAWHYLLVELLRYNPTESGMIEEQLDVWEQDQQPAPLSVVDWVQRLVCVDIDAGCLPY